MQTQGLENLCSLGRHQDFLFSLSCLGVTLSQKLVRDHLPGFVSIEGEELGQIVWFVESREMRWEQTVGPSHGHSFTRSALHTVGSSRSQSFTWSHSGQDTQQRLLSFLPLSALHRVQDLEEVGHLPPTKSSESGVLWHRFLICQVLPLAPLGSGGLSLPTETQIR